jgi:hypothetical protein
LHRVNNQRIGNFSLKYISFACLNIYIYIYKGGRGFLVTNLRKYKKSKSRFTEVNGEKHRHLGPGYLFSSKMNSMRGRKDLFSRILGGIGKGSEGQTQLQYF